MTRLWAIAKNTFLQTLRQPIYGVMIVLTVAVLVLSLPLTTWTMGLGGNYEETDQTMLQNAGLATLLTMGLLTATFCASAGISREVDDKTVLTVVAKPVNRATFILGKFVGLALAMILAYYVNSLVFLLTVRHKVVSSAATPINWPVILFGVTALLLTLATAGLGNYAFGWTFASTSIVAAAVYFTAAVGAAMFVGLEWNLTPLSQTFSADGLAPALFVALFLTLLAVLLLTSVALAASTRLGQILSLLVCVAVLFAGANVPYLSNVLDSYAPGSGFLAWVLPNLTYFFSLDALATGAQMPASLVGLKIGYFACYVAAMLALAVALFQTRGLEAKTAGASMPGAVALLSGLGRIAAAVLAVLAAILLTQKSTYTADGAIRLGIVAVSAFGLWYVFRVFSAGKGWAWWLLLAVAAAICLHGLAAWIGARWGGWRLLPIGGPMIALSALLSAAVVLLLVMPKTRHHFSS